MDEFLVEWHCLAQLVGGLLPKHCIASSLPQYVQHLLWASSRMDTMTVEQLLTQAQAIMTNDKDHKESIATSAQQTHTDNTTHSKGQSLAIGTLVLTIWPETVCRVVQRGQIIKREGLTMRCGV